MAEQNWVRVNAPSPLKEKVWRRMLEGQKDYTIWKNQGHVAEAFSRSTIEKLRDELDDLPRYMVAALSDPVVRSYVEERHRKNEPQKRIPQWKQDQELARRISRIWALESGLR